MKQSRKWIGAATLLCALAAPAFAERVEIKGTGTTAYESGASSGNKPSEADKAKAVAAARLSAWRNYVVTLNPARQQMVSRNEQELTANLDRFVVDLVVIDMVQDPASHTLRVVARAVINDEAVNQYLAKLSVGAGAQVGTRSQDSTFAFVFMSRRASSVRQFDGRRTDVAETDALKTRAADGGVNTQTVVTTGGSTLRKADEMTYAVSSSQDLDTAVGEVLSVSGIEYVAYDDVVANCRGVPAKKFQDEFAIADEPSPGTRNAAINAARECGVRYFAYGTLDSELATVDPVTGNQKVFVSVRAQLLDVTPRLPRRIGSVGPKQYAGLGPNQNVAARNALTLAARDLAKTLVDQLNAKGIR